MRFFFFKKIYNMNKKIFYLLFTLIFMSICARNEVIKTHGLAYLEKREKLIVVNESNKNDTIELLGLPATRGMLNENIWIYVERTTTRGKMLRLGRNELKKNNVLVLEFDDNGIVYKKDFFTKDNMNDIKFVKAITENEIRKENFVYSFLSSIRQKMEQRRK